MSCHVILLAGGSHAPESPFYTAGNPRSNPAAVYTGAPSSQPSQRSASGGSGYHGSRSGSGSFQAAAPQPSQPLPSLYSGPLDSVPAPTPFPTGAHVLACPPPACLGRVTPVVICGALGSGLNRFGAAQYLLVSAYSCMQGLLLHHADASECSCLLEHAAHRVPFSAGRGMLA